MGVILRPSAGVFERRLPHVLVFGTYRAASLPPLDVIDQSTILTTVKFARRIRAPLHFLRELCSDGSGRWLEGCQPQVTDRVFDHPRGSAFSNKEFYRYFNTLNEIERVAVGPQNDSSLQLTISESETSHRRIRALISKEPLQNCSTNAGKVPAPHQRSPAHHDAKEIPLSQWYHSLLRQENP